MEWSKTHKDIAISPGIKQIGRESSIDTQGWSEESERRYTGDKSLMVSVFVLSDTSISYLDFPN